jgi:hypothetical protein
MAHRCRLAVMEQRGQRVKKKLVIDPGEAETVEAHVPALSGWRRDVRSAGGQAAHVVAHQPTKCWWASLSK